MQLLPQRGRARTDAAVARQVLLQEGHGPLDRGVTEVVRGLLQARGQQRLKFRGPKRGVVASPAVRQSVRIQQRPVARQPMIDAGATGSEQAGDRCDRPPSSGF
jgi:hypothetical protein